MYRICVLMTCYNPPKYILEQVDSVLNQKGVIVDLVIRDDCSTKTEWLDRIPNNDQITILHGDVNVGVAHNIIELVNYAYKNKKEYDYYAYCDQDDVWLEDKLIRGIEILKTMDLDKPCLYYSNLTVVDENLIGDKLLLRANVVNNTLGQGLAQIFAFACTFVFNKKMLEAIQIKNIEFMGFDHLVYYIALLTGESYFDEKSYILYRQHGNNVSGDKSRGISLIIKKAIGLFREKEDRARAGGGSFEQISKYLLRTFDGEISEEDTALLQLVSNYKKNKCKLLRCSKIRAGYMPKDVYRAIRILLNRY